MSATTDTTVSVHRQGTIVDLLAIKFGTSAIVERTADGSLVAFDEVWDRDSVVVPSTRLRLLRAHDRAHPLGWLDEFHVDDVGLHARGTLVGGAASLDDVRELVAAGLLADASVGFAPDSTADQWSQPERRNGLARVTRRGARIKEVSLVDQAAVAGSKVLQITQPSTISPTTHRALADAEAAARGNGYVARQRIEHQAEVALLLAEADELIAAGRRWADLDAAASTAAAPAAAPSRGAQTWQELADAEAERTWQRGLDDDRRREFAETIARQRHAEGYAQRQVLQRDTITRASR